MSALFSGYISHGIIIESLKQQQRKHGTGYLDVIFTASKEEYKVTKSCMYRQVMKACRKILQHAFMRSCEKQKATTDEWIAILNGSITRHVVMVMTNSWYQKLALIGNNM